MSSGSSSEVDDASIHTVQVASESAPEDLSAVVDDLLNQLSTKFSTISTELVGKLDDMSRRLDDLEATIQQTNAASQAANEDA